MADKDDIAWWSKGKLSRGMRGDSAVLKKYLPNIAQNLNIIKTSLMSLVKVQEADKKAQYFEDKNAEQRVTLQDIRKQDQPKKIKKLFQQKRNLLWIS